MKLKFEDLRSYHDIEKAIFREEKLRIVFRTNQNDRPKMDQITELTIEIGDNMTLAQAVFAIRSAFPHMPPFVSVVSRCGIIPHGQTLVKNLRFRPPLMSRLRASAES